MRTKLLRILVQAIEFATAKLDTCERGVSKSVGCFRHVKGERHCSEMHAYLSNRIDQDATDAVRAIDQNRADQRFHRLHVSGCLGVERGAAIPMLHGTRPAVLPTATAPGPTAHELLATPARWIFGASPTGRTSPAFFIGHLLFELLPVTHQYGADVLRFQSICCGLAFANSEILSKVALASTFSRRRRQRFEMLD